MRAPARQRDLVAVASHSLIKRSIIVFNWQHDKRCSFSCYVEGGKNKREGSCASTKDSMQKEKHVIHSYIYICTITSIFIDDDDDDEVGGERMMGGILYIHTHCLSKNINAVEQ